MSAPAGPAAAAGATASAPVAVRLLRAELRKVASLRSWWGLLIPVVLLAISVSFFGGAFGAVAAPESGGGRLVLLSCAYALSLVSVFAAVHGVVAATGEFRHRTVTTTYLIGPRGPVFAAKAAVAAGVGVLYALVAVLVGAVSGLLGSDGAGVPPAGGLLGLAAVAVVVCAAWSVLGVAVGTLVTNQVGAMVVLLGYLLLGENVLSLLLTSGRGTGTAARLAAYLPGNAGDVALYDVAAGRSELFGPDLVEGIAGVVAPPPWWGSLLVLGVWTGSLGALARVVAGRRDVT